MTWNNAVEDAATLDDDDLIEACLGLDRTQQSNTLATTLPDWPPLPAQPVLIPIDPDTAAWFQARSTAWRQEVGRVLQAWIRANVSACEPAPSSDSPAS